MKKIGILYHPLKEAALPLAERLEKFLTDRGVSTWICSAWDMEEARARVNGSDLVLSIGGDGTILRAAQTIVPEPVPITGINLGRLGFMTELAVGEAEEKLALMLEGKGWLDERALLQAELTEAEGHSHTYYALNDVVLARGSVARIIFAELSIDDEPVTLYKADGVIVASATGSTGYALAAGGPILNPQSKDIVLVPIMPHLSSAYNLVLPQTAEIKLSLQSDLPATFSIDGHINLPVAGGAVVRVTHSSHTVRFLRIHPEGSFYGTLEQRLKGKQ